jgi:DNA-binding SARP family transcriptional activator/tetratricopeptide (TPR) repeat protein
MEARGTEFRILGPLEVVEDGQALDLGGQKQRALLAFLLLHANEVVSTHRLIEALWEFDPPETAQKALQVYVSQLRKALGRERIVTREPGYVLRIDEAELDIERFERLVEEGKSQEALALWRGRPLSDFAYSRFAQREIARLEDLRLAALEGRIEQDLADGRHDALAGELEAFVAEHPLRERLRGQLLLALYRSGRQAEALEAYQDARRALTDELGIEPGRELRELQQAILNQDPALDLAAEAEVAGDVARAPFVGRARELDELTSGLEDAFGGHGRLFLLVGEPGIGKSRLAEEFVSRARARAARVVVGRCWEAGGAPAYWPWVQSLRAYVREAEPEVLRPQLDAGAPELAQLLPELRDLFPDLPEPHALESESARFRLFEAASSFLRRAAQTRPLVVVLDDLHAADEPSLLLLQFLARELADSRLLVVAAYRDVDPTPTHPLTAAVTELAREPVTRSLALAGLDERDVAEFIELISDEAPSEELVDAIFEETEGNPLFVGEIVRLLAAEGGLDGGTPRLAIPQSIRDVIGRRLRHLSDESNRVLALACVLGREFGLDALSRVADVSEDELLETLDEAMTAGVVSDVPGSPGRLRFAHLLIRDTLYEGLTMARRVRLHRLALEALETLYGREPGAHLAELSHHAVAGSEFDKALDYARSAGDRAFERLGWEEAARLYETALDALALVDPDDERRRCELLLSLGEAASRAGNSGDAKQAFLDAAGIARRLGLSRELARAAVGYGGRIAWVRAGDDERIVPLLEEGIAVLGDQGDELRVRLLGRLAGALRDEYSRDRRDRLSAEAVELARQIGNAAALAYALEGRAHAIIGPDTVAECLALGSELLEMAAQSEDTERLVAAHMFRIGPLLFVGDVQAAEADLAAASRLADELRQPVQLWLVSEGEAMLAIATGKLADAEGLVAQALALGERAHPRAALTHYWLQRCALCDFRGSGLEEVEPGIGDVVAEHPARPVFRCALAHLYARLGRLDDARRELERLAEDDFSFLPFDQEWLFGMSFLAETSALLGHPDSAGALYRLLVPWAALNAVDVAEGLRGSVSRYLGLLATALGRWDDAAHHFEDAIEMNGRMGARPWLAHTQEDYARMLFARGESGDDERVRELHEQALATYRELGMDGPLREAETFPGTR